MSTPSVERHLARLAARLESRLDEVQEAGMDFAGETHMNAPRGGGNYNSLGQPRSAEGEPPAEEFGELLDRILNGSTRGPRRRTFVVNYERLEWGNWDGDTYTGPRPMGRMVAEHLPAWARENPPL